MIYNLTQHVLTPEQINALEKMFPNEEIKHIPQGQIFSSIEQRETWAETWANTLSPECNYWDSHDIANIAIVGGDTASFMILQRLITKHQAFADGEISEGRSTTVSRASVMFLVADTERIRDENDRFIFNFKRWLIF